jgi:hypothetical protein
MLEALNKTQENKLSMYDTVTAFLDGNEAIVSTVPALVTAKADLATNVEKIRAKGSEKRDSTQGKTQNKYDAEEAMVNAVLEIASPLYSVARRAGDNELKGICDVTEYKLKRMRDTELESRARTIQAKATDNAAALADYSITAEMITALSGKIDAYHAAIGEQGRGMAVRSGATQTLAELFQVADEVLCEDMDKIVERLRTSEADFYGKYWSARVIKDLGVRHEETPVPPPPAP